MSSRVSSSVQAFARTLQLEPPCRALYRELFDDALWARDLWHELLDELFGVRSFARACQHGLSGRSSLASVRRALRPELFLMSSLAAVLGHSLADELFD